MQIFQVLVSNVVAGQDGKILELCASAVWKADAYGQTDAQLKESFMAEIKATHSLLLSLGGTKRKSDRDSPFTQLSEELKTPQNKRVCQDIIFVSDINVEHPTVGNFS